MGQWALLVGRIYSIGCDMWGALARIRERQLHYKE
jgi:hypothetical protein